MAGRTPVGDIPRLDHSRALAHAAHAHRPAAQLEFDGDLLGARICSVIIASAAFRRVNSALLPSSTAASMMPPACTLSIGIGILMRPVEPTSALPAGANSMPVP